MAILYLHHGYFARIGHDPVINDDYSPGNEKRRKELSDFYLFFRSKENYLTKFMSEDSSKKPEKFHIPSDNCRINNKSAETFISERKYRYSIVVHSIKDDFLNNGNRGRRSSKELIKNMYQLSESYKIQIFAIDSTKYPLKNNIMEAEKDNIGHYLMDNAYDSKERLGKVCKTW